MIEAFFPHLKHSLDPRRHTLPENTVPVGKSPRPQTSSLEGTAVTGEASHLEKFRYIRKSVRFAEKDQCEAISVNRATDRVFFMYFSQSQYVEPMSILIGSIYRVDIRVVLLADEVDAYHIFSSL